MIAIDREILTNDTAKEILPLAQKCWNESTEIKAETCAFYGERDFQVEPDVERYQGLGDGLVLVTLRDEGKLQGYILGFTYNSMHHKKILCGMADTMYVELDYRAYTGVVADRFEKEMRKLGVKIIGWPTHINGPVYEVLKALGYVGDDIVMEKRICA